MLFLDNKYTKTYYAIVNKAKTRILFDGYTENHHIIPKKLGGSDESHNRVKLTAREHLLCHLLLLKMLNGSKRYQMLHAINMMTNRLKITSRSYQLAKEEWNQRNKLQTHSKETRIKISRANKGKTRTFTDQHKANMSAAWDIRRGRPKVIQTDADKALAKEQQRLAKSIRMKELAITDPGALKSFQQAGLLARQAKAKPKPAKRSFKDEVVAKQRMSEARKAYWDKKRAEKP